MHVLVQGKEIIVPGSLKACADTDRMVLSEAVLCFCIAVLPLVHLRASEATLVFLETVISFSCAAH